MNVVHDLKATLCNYYLEMTVSKSFWCYRRVGFTVHYAKTESYVIEKDFVVCPQMSSSCSASTLCDLCLESTARDCTCLHHYHSCFEPPRRGSFEVRGWKGHQGEWETEPHSVASVNMTPEVKKFQRMLTDEIKEWKKRQWPSEMQDTRLNLRLDLSPCQLKSKAADRCWAGLVAVVVW